MAGKGIDGKIMFHGNTDRDGRWNGGNRDGLPHYLAACAIGPVMLSCVVPARVNILGMALLMFLCPDQPAILAAEVKANETSSVAAQVPLELRRGAVFVKVRVNDSEPLAFKLDTGFGVTTIHPELVETLGLKPAGTLTINGIAGAEQADWLSGANFDFGGTKYSPRRVVRIPSDARRPRRQRDGILGSGFFRRFVVELDAAGKTLTLHVPDSFNYNGKGEIIPLQFRRDTPTVEAMIHLPDREPLRARYEIDSGCDGALCLGHDFVKANKLDEAVGDKRASSRTGVGGSVDTHETRLPQFQLGTRKLDDVEANFFREGSPVDDDLAGHIGMGVLREFKVILDYSRRRMILESLK